VSSPARELAVRLARSKSIAVLTGAGVSAGSGIPTFRDASGLWRRFRPEDLATPEAFARDPKTVWEWYAWRRKLIAGAVPNAAHEVLASWSRRVPCFTLVTQNVDGLHERAGTQNVLRYHGSIWEVACAAGCEGSPPRWRDDRVPLPEMPPACPHCGGLLRPGVVWFGEAIDPTIASRALDAGVRSDVFLVVGTSSAVYPAAGLTEQARRAGAFTAEVNPEPGARVDLSIAGRAEEVLPEVEREWAALPSAAR
jgi:NAD-dependent deacetylase